MMTKSEFLSHCRSLLHLSSRQADEYFEFHKYRLFHTYKFAARFLPYGGSCLSFGAGSAYVEGALVKSYGAKVTVVDLPEAVASFQQLYDKLGLEATPVDLTQGCCSLDGKLFDLALSCEIVEHLPRPPEEHFAMMADQLRVGGHLLVSTPNAGSLGHVLRTLLHRPTLAPASRTFGPVCLENEAIHRREYMRSEIEEALRLVGVNPLGIEYIWDAYPKGVRALALGVPQAVVPAFRPAMSIIGRKQEVTASSREPTVAAPISTYAKLGESCR